MYSINKISIEYDTTKQKFFKAINGRQLSIFYELREWFNIQDRG